MNAEQEEQQPDDRIQVANLRCTGCNRKGWHGYLYTLRLETAEDDSEYTFHSLACLAKWAVGMLDPEEE